MAEVLVLHAALRAGGAEARAHALLGRLPYARRLELEWRDPAARRASLAALELVLLGAARVRGAAVGPELLRFPQGGRPHLEGGPGFSVSHTSTRVAVALVERGDIGIDVEDARMPDGRPRAGLERWTATEAALKAAGAGLRAVAGLRLAADLATAEFGGALIHITPLDLGGGWVVRVATFEPATSVLVEEVRVP